MTKTKPAENCIYYRGVLIRQYPIVKFRVSVPEMKRVIDAKLDRGISAKNAIKNKMVFCEPCTNPLVQKFQQQP
jgi:hypothetical protein